MAAHRYWRASGLEAVGGGGVSLAGFHLLSAGVRVDAPATITASTAPSTGSVDNLKDGDANTLAGWPSTSGLTLQWDFGGTPQEVTDIRITAADSEADFLRGVTVQYSDDATAWTTQFVASGISWPGARQQTPQDVVEVAVTVLDSLSVPTLASVPMPFFADVLDTLGRARRDYIFTREEALGVGRIVGTVKEDGSPDVPVRRKVRCVRERDGLLVRETWSAEVTGAYQFDDLDETEAYIVYSLDYKHNYRAVIADNLTVDNGGVELAP